MRARAHETMRRVAATVMVAVTLASPVLFTAETAYAVGWVSGVPSDPCEDFNVDEAKKGDDPTEGNQGAPSGEGAWLTPGTDEYAVAKEIFDTLVNEYGFSGAAACGVLGNIRGESGFIPDRAQGAGTLRFGMDSKNPPAGLDGGGGGLFQFTPYTKFTNSDYWGKIDSEGWGVQNQIAFVWDSEFGNRVVETYFAYNASAYGGGYNCRTVEEFLSTNDPSEAAQAFLAGYERAASAHPERSDWAQEANAVFNKDNIPADESKWKIGGSSTAPGIDSDSSQTSTKDKDKDCREQQLGAIDSTLWLNVAIQFSKDESIGYSQNTRKHNPNMDCSSFVWYCLTSCGVASLTEESLGGAPFSTSTEREILEKAGFVGHKFTGDYSNIPAGAIMWYDGHTEIYMGQLDSTAFDGSESTYNEAWQIENGTPYTIGAHGPEGSGTDGANGDQLQEGNSWLDGEVGAVSYSQDWEYYYTPDNVAGLEYGGGQSYADALSWQKKIVDAAKVTPTAGQGYCAAWVTHVYQNAGLNAPGGNACCMYLNYCTSSNQEDLRVGMIIAIQESPTSQGIYNNGHVGYGHVGVYIGDGMVMSNVGDIKTQTLQSWLDYYDGTNGHVSKWGYPPGMPSGD